MRFLDVLAQVIGWLVLGGRLSYRALKAQLDLSDEQLEAIKFELITARRLARDIDGQVLVWAWETPPAVAEAPASDPVLDAATPSSLPPPGRPIAAGKRDRGRPAGEAGLDDGGASGARAEAAAAPAPARRNPDAERRQLTVMFCDLVGSTDLSGRLDPEDLREVVRAYQAAAAEAVRRFGGHIAQYLGDGILVYFGYPAAHGDDAQRAVHAGLGIVAAMGPLNAGLEARYGLRLAVRIGVHTGPVVVGEMGAGGRHEQLALGETPNVAARLQGLAAPDTVVVSGTTARLAQRAFALEDLGAHSLKGVPEPVEVWGVRGLREEEDQDEASGEPPAPAGAPLLVGRDEEIGLLLRRWEQSQEGLGQVVLLSGEPGIGKSALVEVVRAHVRREGRPRFTVRCSQYHQSAALYPVIALLERRLRFQREDGPGTRLAKLEQGLPRGGLPLEEVVPLFAALLSVPVPEERYPTPGLTPQQRRQQTQDALVAWWLAEAERQPVLVVWEDLHWADPSTVELLGLFVDQAPTAAMLHVLTYRPDFAPPWPARSHLTPITLNRLERPQIDVLVTRLAGDKRVPAEVVQYVVTKTDGVPLYVEELTKALLESRVLRDQGNHYALTAPLREVAIPATLQDSLMARLDRLPAIREVAQVGAVLGREFAYEMLRALAAMEEPALQDALRQLVEAELLYQRGRPPRARYIFKHALVQDAAYQSLLRRTRQQYHGQVAQLLVARFPEVVEREPELVAHHYTEAGLAEQAITYWSQAGRRALQRSANLEAARHLTTALELLAALPEAPARAHQELDLRLALAQALVASKGMAAPEVEQTYTRARALCDQVGETPQLLPTLRGLWRFYQGRGALAAARELGEQLAWLAQREADPVPRLEAHDVLATTLLFQGDYAAARANVEQGIALTDPATQRAQVLRQGEASGVRCLAVAANTLWCLGFPAQALRRSQEALALAQELAHPYSLAIAEYYAAYLHYRRREAPALQAQVDALMGLATAQGFPLYIGTGMCWRGWALAMEGEGAASLAQIHQGLETVGATRQEVSRPLCLILLAEAAVHVGQVEEGLRLLAEALTLLEANGQDDLLAEAFRLQGASLLLQASPDAAQGEACFQRALGVARRQQARSWELRAALSLGRLWQQQGRRDEAYDLLAPIYGWFTEGFDSPDLQAAKALLEGLGPPHSPVDAVRSSDRPDPVSERVPNVDSRGSSVP
jgi:class 3 adenylate cyclase/predicted ATPase